MDQANDLVARYHDVLVEGSKYEDSTEVKDNINDVINALNVLANSHDTVNDKAALNNVENLNANLDSLKKDVTDKTNALGDYLYYKFVYYKFNSELDKIIMNLINSTNQKAEKLRMEAAKSGIIIESQWVAVNIGGRTVFIDPCRVRGV